MLSALGLIASERRRDTARTVMLSGAELTAERIAAEVAGSLRETLGDGLEDAEVEVAYELRYRGPGVRAAGRRPPRRRTPPSSRERFAAEHERRYGYRDPDAAGRAGQHPRRAGRACRGPSRAPSGRPAELERDARRARFGGEWVEAEVLRGEPPAGEASGGPCVFELPETTLVLPPGWRAEVDERGNDRRRSAGAMSSARPGLAPGAGRRAARRLRRDGRGADPLGALAQHQGAPRLLDRAVRRRRRAGDAGRAHPRPPRLDARRGRGGARLDQRPGDLWILNDPFGGGTHLPDITLISPLFARRAS